MTRSLEAVARRVNWYAPPEKILADTDLFLCQVMARGRPEDLIAVQQSYSSTQFRAAYRNAPPGLFTKRAWAYWGLMLDLSDLPLPERFPGANRLDWRTAGT